MVLLEFKLHDGYDKSIKNNLIDILHKKYENCFLDSYPNFVNILLHDDLNFGILNLPNLTSYTPRNWTLARTHRQKNPL